MLWVLAGSTWAIALLSLIALRYEVPIRLRQAIGIVALVPLAIVAWRWWSGMATPTLDTAFFVMMGGLFCDDLVTKIGERRSAVLDRADGQGTN
ncbi:hypothetical protein ASE90_04760 [Sphingomonas sp. Leaf67]|nr:hypothetical protein ASE90_04760 [Sphingomonas sp. Leaf67]